jgi:hypothetical protein
MILCLIHTDESVRPLRKLRMSAFVIWRNAFLSIILLTQ